MKNVHELEQGIAWDDSLLTGNALVDMQHQKLFERVSDLVHSCEDGSDIDRLHDTLEYLVNHAIRHFTDEEALQLEYGFPGYEAHKRRHDEFRERIGELEKRFNMGGSSDELSKDINKFIIRWLVYHIKQEDKAIVEHIRARA